MREGIIGTEAIDKHNQAEAFKVYVERRKESLEVQNEAAEITLRASRKVGEFSKKLPKDVWGRPVKKSFHCETTYSKEEILKENGLSKSTAFRYELLADIPLPEFEAFITQKKEAGRARLFITECAR